MNSFPLGRFQGALIGAAVGYRRCLYLNSRSENPPWESDWLKSCDFPAGKSNPHLSIFKSIFENAEKFERAPNNRDTSNIDTSNVEANESLAKIFLSDLPHLLCEAGMRSEEKNTWQPLGDRNAIASGREMAIAIPCQQILMRALWGTLSDPLALSSPLAKILTSPVCQEMQTKQFAAWQTTSALLDRNASLEEARENFENCAFRGGVFCFLSAAEYFSIAVGRAERLGCEAAAIAGTLAGAHVGVEGIPTSWLCDSPDRLACFYLLGARLLAYWAGDRLLPIEANWLDFPAVAPYPHA